MPPLPLPLGQAQARNPLQQAIHSVCMYMCVYVYTRKY
jgi:hypothetical protein